MSRKTRNVPVNDPDHVPPRKRSAVVGVGVGILATGLLLSSLGPLVSFIDMGPAPESASDHAGHGEVDARIAALEAEVRSQPKDGARLVALGDAYYDAGRYPLAAETYAKAIGEKAGTPDVLTDMGTALFYQGKTNEAIAAFHRALHDAPQHLNAHMNLGVVYRSAGNAVDAKAHWTKALGLTQDPELQKRLKVLLQTVGG